MNKLFNVKYSVNDDGKQRLACVLATCELMARAVVYAQYSGGMQSVKITKVMESNQEFILLWKEA